MDFREQSYRRILLILGVVFCFFLIFFGQLFRIQILQYSHYSRLAASQREKLLVNEKVRGSFLDRNGKILRGPVTAWYLVIQNKLKQSLVSGLSSILPEGFLTEYRKHSKTSFWIYSKPLTQQQIDLIYPLCNSRLKIIARQISRDYRNTLAWHLLGFVGQNQGFSGLEYLYEPVIGSKDADKTGSVFAVTDGVKQLIPGLGFRVKSKVNTAGVLLTIDERVQRITDEVLDRENVSGAVVILDAKSGEILAMSSRPLIQADNPANSLSDDSHPFLNRAISAYNPGSIFKLVILSAGIDSGRLLSTEYFSDQGFYQLRDKKWFCTTSNGEGHGLLTLTDALAYSCNPVFIEIALRLQPDLILKYADRFGLGQPCNIGLKEEAWGELPSGIGLSYGEQANLALGQQTVYITPLQVASLTQAIANNGVRQPPKLVRGYFTQSGEIQWLNPERPIQVIKPETAALMREMMAAVVNMGTGKEAQLSWGVAGKTGTAQTGTKEDLPENAWFAGLTPVDNPCYVTVVFCEKGVSGGKTAAPIFREIMSRIIKLKSEESTLINF